MDWIESVPDYVIMEYSDYMITVKSLLLKLISVFPFIFFFFNFSISLFLDIVAQAESSLKAITTVIQSATYRSVRSLTVWKS